MTKLITLVVLLATIGLLPACSPTAVAPNNGQSQVAQAFETSGTIAVQPYTRTIFSTGNF